MKALIDGDILRYEIGFAAEAGWKAITESEEVPPWDYVEDLLHQRIATILSSDEALNSYKLYLSAGKNFRFDIAKSKPYKGTRIDKKPWHFNNLTAYMCGAMETEIVTYLEADDAMAIDHISDPDTMVCSRDKDLRQVPGVFYSWELGRQPSFGPTVVTDPGTVELSKDRRDLKGTGFKFFCGQMLVGDKIDNIPGLPGCGPVKAMEVLDGLETKEECLDAVYKGYQENSGITEYDDYYLEQGQLCWIVRRLNEDGTPQLWDGVMTE